MKTDIHGGDVYETNDRLFHVRIAEATRNSVLVSVVSMLWDLRESPVYAGLMRHAVTDGVRARSIADHERIAVAVTVHRHSEKWIGWAVPRHAVQPNHTDHIAIVISSIEAQSPERSGV